MVHSFLESNISNKINNARFFKSGLPGQILEKVATKGECDENFLKKGSMSGSPVLNYKFQ
jgi:hypothetical protein